MPRFHFWSTTILWLFFAQILQCVDAAWGAPPRVSLRPSATLRAQPVAPEDTVNGFDVTRLVDSATGVPQSALTFGLLSAPSFDGVDIVFKGASSDGLQSGVYRRDDQGAVSRIADITTPYPLSPDEFDFLAMFYQPEDMLMSPVPFNAFRLFEPPILSGNDVIFSGSVQQLKAGFLTGLFRVSGGQDIERLVTTIFDVEPAGGRTFFNIARASYADGRLGFAGTSQSNSYTAVYRLDANGLVELANLDTPMPGSPNSFDDFGFSGPGATAVLGDSVAFIGRTLVGSPNVDGAYVSDGNGVTRVVDSQALVPGSLSQFGLGFSSVAGNAQQLCVLHGTHGAFRRNGNGLDPAITSQSAVAGFPGLKFNHFSGLSVADADQVAVVGGFSIKNRFLVAMLGRGLYLDQGNGPQPVVLAQNTVSVIFPFMDAPVVMQFGGDVLDGQTVADIALGSTGLYAAGVAFTATFADGSQAIYTAAPMP